MKTVVFTQKDNGDALALATFHDNPHTPQDTPLEDLIRIAIPEAKNWLEVNPDELPDGALRQAWRIRDGKVVVDEDVARELGLI